MSKPIDFKGINPLHYWVSALDSVTDPIIIYDNDFHILLCNKAYQQLAKLKFKEIIGKRYFEVFPKLDEPLHAYTASLKTLTPKEQEIHIDDKCFRSRAYITHDEERTTSYIVNILEDITDHKQTQEHLKLFRKLLDHSGDAIEVLDPSNMAFLDVNETSCVQLGYSREELLSMSIFDVDPMTIQNSGEYKQLIAQVKQTGNIHFESHHQRKDGSTFPVEVSLSLVNLEKPYFISIARDITERKEAEERTGILRMLLDHSNDAIEVIDPSTLRILDVNEAECSSLGYSREELLNMKAFDIDAEYNKASANSIKEMTKKSGGITIESVHRRKDGTEFPVEISTSYIELGQPYIFGIVRDITDRKQSENALKRANRALQTLSSVNIALIQAKNEDTFLKTVTDIIVATGGYSMAMVCYAEDNAEKSLTPKAWSGEKNSYFWEGHPSWEDNEQGQLPISQAIRDGKTSIRRNIATESKYEPWREAALARGYVSNIALPLCNEDNILGALSIYTSTSNVFDKDEVTLLEELTGDLAYGIITLRAREEREQQALLLKKSLEQTIQAIATTVEIRDPYTAGHQRRVSELSVAIAQKMGLPPDQTQGIEFAAIIHDLGKIQIPAEILSKPGKLTEIEYQLVQNHAQAGHDIVKDIDFPWPIAEIILQHHERIDGSGYPQGLKGDQILLESKIIAVADVVDAISSHRPYRAALGIELALEEIQQGKGRFYDADVVEACLELFANNEFTISD
ncbi:PAS domain S-box protein [Hydrogenovibrio kuenenii]|uniref:PAS domain S-box protein n=1 Tax=Hydrogenovibrio kuenenii TaxID=63658 RepID=UPI00046508C4|nr:PAS domain S-box protein [Hydrogenovibrio kuenenii]